MMGNSTSNDNQDEETNQDLINKRRVRDSRLYVEIRPNQWPIVYSHKYNIGFFEAGMLAEDSVIEPIEATREDLLVVHTKCYLHSLCVPCEVARIMEVPPVACLPSCLIDHFALKPMRFQTGGTIIAARLALEKNWSINIGGGFHHACSNKGGGFCVYADISLALQFLFLENRIKSAMIVDLDAHQGNGHERDFANDSRVYIFDIFNKGIYPHDSEAKGYISRSVPLNHYTDDREYLQKLASELSTALGEFNADLIVYNAGTDCLIGDPLGALSITPEGIIQRDQIVFELAKQADTPIVMLTSGGYLRESAKVISDSILNLRAKNLIQLT
uniref:Histone deacetylase 11 n=1 Tax=Acrobeloides nanus TaxID=290746 RepID=A0A914DJZ5_9BILA